MSMDVGALIPELTEEQIKLFQEYHFNAEDFTLLRSELKKGLFPLNKNILNQSLRAPCHTDFIDLLEPSPAVRLRMEQIGKDAMSRGQVGFVILNGGMATRFGGIVKGTVEVFDSYSFLNLKLLNIHNSCPNAEVFLLNSFATHESTRTHLETAPNKALQEKLNIHPVLQSISVRLNPDGTTFVDSQGQPSLYAPGHGDIFTALASSAPIKEFKARGGKYLLVSNVDNLGATADPTVIGGHISGQSPVSFEVARRNAADKGGAPVWCQDKLLIVEGFRFPDSFDITPLPAFNTNTMFMKIDLLEQNIPLTWFRVEKTINDSQCIQFERLMGEVTSFVKSSYALIPRQGLSGRFFPVKTPEDMAQQKQALIERFQADFE